MKHIYSVFIFFLSSSFCYSEALSEYINYYLYDMKHYNTIGYKDISSINNEYIYLQGSLTHTGDKYSFAIEGDGFIKIQNKEGDVFFTRCCQFIINEEGQFITGNNMIFMPNVKLDFILMPEVYIYSNGSMKIINSNGTEEIYEIELFSPTNDSHNYAYGNYYRFSETKKTTGRLIQGFLEFSTVNISKIILKLECFLYLSRNAMSESQYNYISVILQQFFYVSENYYKSIHDCRTEKSYSFVGQTIYDSDLMNYFVMIVCDFISSINTQ